MNANTKSPCYCCTERRLGCHGTCQDYKKYQRKCRERTERQRQYYYWWHETKSYGK